MARSINCEKCAKKFLVAMFDNGGTLTRGALSGTIFRRNFGAAQLNALLEYPALAGLFNKGRGAHGATTYRLTLAGWLVLVRGLKRGIRPFKINATAIAEALERLKSEGDPWALRIESDARDARKWREQEAKAKIAAEWRAAKAAEKPMRGSPALAPEQRRPAPVSKSADDEAWATFRSAIGMAR